MTSSQKPRLIPLLVFPLPPPHLVFIPCISSLCSLGFFGTEAHFFYVFSLLLFPPLILLYLCILMLTPPITPITPITLASDIPS